MASPYRVVLGAAFDELHPRLQTYFDAIPVGGTGHGRGVFDTVGTPRRWLWPVLALLSGAHVVFPVWEKDVPFTVENTPVSGPGDEPAVRAVRVFRLRSGRRTMIDRIAAHAGGIVDTLGSPPRIEARFDAAVDGGGLTLTSTSVVLLLGRMRIPVPGPFAPRVVLSERFDDERDMQRVSIALHHPLVGRLYEYAGSFRYGIRTGGAGQMSQRIVIAGASGFIGRYLADSFRRSGQTVQLIGRRGADASWGDAEGILRLVDGADLVINLAGKSVNCRYTDANRAEIFRSRLETTRAIGDAVAASRNPPPLWLNASTATIYRHAEDRPMTEREGEIGSGFSVNVATAWERAFFERDLPGTRRVALRMAIVLGDGSALVPLIRLVRCGLGGPQRDGRWFASTARRNAGTFHEFRARGGRQKFSWVHIRDVSGAIEFIRTHPELEGVVNVSSPHPTDNRGFMAALRRVLRVPFGLPAFRWMLETGAIAIRTETELVLKSRWAVPERLLDAGYAFAFPQLEPALAEIVAGRRVAARRNPQLD